MLILNKELLEQLDTIQDIFFKKKTVQLILLIAIILKIIFLQKEFILKTKILSSSLFASSLIDNLIIN